MCSRYSFVSSKEQIELQFGLEAPPNLRVRYNIAPTQHAYIITNEQNKRLQYITWGLIPNWSKDGRNEGKLINARKESITSTPSFRIPIRHKRCLVLADSFYEWKRKGQNQSPFRITRQDDRIMAMAGIWDVWYKGNYAVKSFSIVTQAAYGEMADLYSRMPILLDPEDQKSWLEEIPLNQVMEIMEKREDQSLQIYPISKKINSLHYNGLDLHHQAEDQTTTL